LNKKSKQKHQCYILVQNHKIRLSTQYSFVTTASGMKKVEFPLPSTLQVPEEYITRHR